jgi:thioredoxin-like negative regulator of GroEL
MNSEITTPEQLKVQLDNSAMMLLYFYNDNCAPCIALRPKVEAMISEEFPEMKQFYINAEKYSFIAATHEVFASPTIIIFVNGMESLRFSKFVSVYDLSEKIGRYYNMIFGI